MKAVVIFSGGMDSGTALLQAVNKYGIKNVYAISIHYGQKHSVELIYAKAFCKDNGIRHRLVDLSQLKDLLGASALTSDQEVPKGHYEDESMKKTVVPNRNAILLSIAEGYAISIGACAVITGVHAGDHAIYPDCRREFIDALNKAFSVGNYAAVKILAPYLNMTKADIAAIGEAMGIDYGRFWTCYDPQLNESYDGVACGKCGACVERQEAMAESGATDTMEYAE